jgi:DNA-binding NtrC family response regulator
MGKLNQNKAVQENFATEQKVLLIDDDRTSLHLMSRFLTSIGCNPPLVARTGKAAKKALKLDPSLIVLDIELPDGCGLGLLSELRKQNNHTPVIVVSSSTEFKNIIHALQDNVFWYLAKPINKFEFLGVVKRAFLFFNLVRQNSLLASSLNRVITQKAPHGVSATSIIKKANNKSSILPSIELLRSEQLLRESERDQQAFQLFAGLSLEEIEQRALIETLASCKGNKAQAARKLGISEKSIYNKIKRFNIQISAKQSALDDKNEEASS